MLPVGPLRELRRAHLAVSPQSWQRGIARDGSDWPAGFENNAASKTSRDSADTAILGGSPAALF
jgi:hypothetical protein